MGREAIVVLPWQGGGGGGFLPAISNPTPVYGYTCHTSKQFCTADMFVKAKSIPFIPSPHTYRHYPVYGIARLFLLPLPSTTCNPSPYLPCFCRAFCLTRRGWVHNPPTTEGREGLRGGGRVPTHARTPACLRTHLPPRTHAPLCLSVREGRRYVEATNNAWPLGLLCAVVVNVVGGQWIIGRCGTPFTSCPTARI